jgi:hypothetical protein
MKEQAYSCLQEASTPHPTCDWKEGEPMAPHKPRTGKKYFTIAQANAMLPLVRVIVRDVADLAQSLRDRHQRLNRINNSGESSLSDAHQEEAAQAQTEFERGCDQMREYERELEKLGIELKDYFTGLIDFPCWMDDHEIYLCWRLGEAEVAHWHELDAGFAGRQKLMVDAESK